VRQRIKRRRMKQEKQEAKQTINTNKKYTCKSREERNKREERSTTEKQ
jgi:hypothetical protein